MSYLNASDGSVGAQQCYDLRRRIAEASLYGAHDRLDVGRATELQRRGVEAMSIR